jgi:hypothetical protein
LPLSEGGDERYMTVLGKGWAAAKPTTGSCHISLGCTENTSCCYSAVGVMTVGETRTENTFPNGIFIATSITVVTLMWCLLCRNLVTAISLASLFCLSGVMSILL